MRVDTVDQVFLKIINLVIFELPYIQNFGGFLWHANPATYINKVMITKSQVNHPCIRDFTVTNSGKNHVY